MKKPGSSPTIDTPYQSKANLFLDGERDKKIKIPDPIQPERPPM